MSNSEINLRLEHFKAKDVKSLVQQAGKAREGNFEFTLKEPSSQDPTLQAIINDPFFELRPIGEEPRNGVIYYDLKTIDRQIRIKVSCQPLDDSPKGS